MNRVKILAFIFLSLTFIKISNAETPEFYTGFIEYLKPGFRITNVFSDTLHTCAKAHRESKSFDNPACDVLNVFVRANETDVQLSFKYIQVVLDDENFQYHLLDVGLDKHLQNIKRFSIDYRYMMDNGYEYK